jgi:hypothetical protein
MSKPAISGILLFFAIFLSVLGLATLVPHTATLVSDLGYNSWCPFAPWSTLTLLVLGGLCWAVRRHINTQTSN